MTTTDLPASLIPTLAGHYYTDPAIFALEQSRIFEQMWFCAVRSADLAPGSFRRVQVGRESVLVVRGRDGQLRSFLNVCRHRGSTLAAADSGELKRSIQCPYHAWTYGLDGKLVAAPNLTKMPDIDRERYGLLPVHLREWLGYAWVCLADEPPSFEEDVIGAVVERLGDVAVHRSLRPGRAFRRPAHPLRRQGQLETDHRELHGVLPLRHHPPRADGGAAGIRRRLRGPVLRRPRRRVRRGHRRASPSTAAKASAGCPASPASTTGAITPSRSSPPSS